MCDHMLIQEMKGLFSSFPNVVSVLITVRGYFPKSATPNTVFMHILGS